jgi:hypothetical protein
MVSVTLFPLLFPTTVLFVFCCVPERKTPYLLFTTLIPSVSVSVLMSGNGRNGRRSE